MKTRIFRRYGQFASDVLDQSPPIGEPYEEGSSLIAMEKYATRKKSGTFLVGVIYRKRGPTRVVTIQR